MNHRHDGSTIDLERALVRVMAERRCRAPPARGASHGRARRRARRRSSRPARARPCRRPPPRRPRRAGRRPAAAATRRGAEPPRPRARRRSSTSTTGTRTSARRPSRSSRTSTGSRSSTTSSRTPTTMMAKIERREGGGYDISYPTSVEIPRSWRATASSSRSTRPASRTSANLGAEWSDPGYDPGNAHSDAVHVVDDRLRLGHGEDHRGARQLGGALGPGLQRQARMLDDIREVFAAGA